MNLSSAAGPELEPRSIEHLSPVQTEYVGASIENLVGALLYFSPADRRVIVHRGDQLIDHVYFPETAVVAMIDTMDDDSTVEVGIIGHEGEESRTGATTSGLGASANRLLVFVESVRAVPYSVSASAQVDQNAHANVYLRFLQRHAVL